MLALALALTLTSAPAGEVRTELQPLILLRDSSGLTISCAAPSMGELVESMFYGFVARANRTPGFGLSTLDSVAQVSGVAFAVFGFFFPEHRLQWSVPSQTFFVELTPTGLRGRF